jgi:hypothetical protein
MKGASSSARSDLRARFSTNELLNALFIVHPTLFQCLDVGGDTLKLKLLPGNNLDEVES